MHIVVGFILPPATGSFSRSDRLKKEENESCLLYIWFMSPILVGFILPLATSSFSRSSRLPGRPPTCQEEWMRQQIMQFLSANTPRVRKKANYVPTTFAIDLAARRWAILPTCLVVQDPRERPGPWLRRIPPRWLPSRTPAPTYIPYGCVYVHVCIYVSM